MFADEARDALKYWAFSPARLGSCGTAEQRGRQTMVFEHDGDPQIKLMPLTINELPQLPRSTRETTLVEHRSMQSAAASAFDDPRAAIPIKRVQPEYPLRALERRKEGMVAASFLIEVDGSVSNIDVVDTVNGFLFRRSAMQALRQWKFNPRMRNGRAVEWVACHEFIFHLDEYERSGKLSRQRERDNIRAFGPQ